MEVAQVGKHLVGVGHALVDIVEVGQQQLSPTIEVVERFVKASVLDEALVQVGNEFQLVGYAQRGMLREEFADGIVGRTPDGASSLPREMFVEEDGGTLVGKHYCRPCEIVAKLAENVLRHIF